MKQPFRITRQRLVAAAPLAVLLLQGAMAQEVITEPTLEIGYGPLANLQSTPDGKHFVACIDAHRGARLLLFDIEAGRVSQRYGPLLDPALYERERVDAFALSGDGALLAASEIYGPLNDGTSDHNEVIISVRDVATGTLVRTVARWDFTTSGYLSVISLAWSSDSTRLLAGLNPGATACLYNVETGALIREFAHPGRIHNAALSPDGTQVLTGGRRTYNHIACLWDSVTGELIRQWPFLETGVAVAFSPDGANVLMGNDAVYLYEATSGQLIRKFDSPVSDGGLESVAFSPEGTKVVASVDFVNQPAITCLWKASTAELLHTLEGELPSFTANGQALLTKALGCEDFGARLYDTETGEIARTFDEFSPIGEWMEFSRDGTKLLTGGQAAVWNVKTGRLIRRLCSGTPLLQGTRGVCGTFSPDGTQALIANGIHHPGTGTGYLTVDVHDTASGELLRTFHAEAGLFINWIYVALSPDCTKVALAGAGCDSAVQKAFGAVEVWDLETGRLLRRFLIGTGPGEPEVYCVVAVAFSPDGQHVFGGVSFADGSETVQVWHIQNGDLVRELNIDHDGLLILSSDGRRLLTNAGGAVDYAGLWDAESGQFLRSFPGARRTGVALSRDDTEVLTAAAAGFQLWDAETGELLVRLVPGERTPTGPAAFSPDGRKVVTGSVYGSALLWSLVPEIIMNIAREPSGATALTWQDPADGSPYALQRCGDISTGDWTDVTVTPPGRYEITEPNGTMFYRLSQP